MTKPILLTVDDDPEVLAAIERDLREHYRNDYLVLKAKSGDEALKAAREIEQRGMSIALFLVDQRMPGMTGTELLVDLRKLFPEARKVLLTAYADTGAAIDSINEIGLDHYLLKPWAPPDERLYPVLDDLLAEWKMHARPPYDGIRVAGGQWSRQCYLVKDFLARNHVPYQWQDVDREPPVRDMVLRLAGGLTRLPVVLFPDGSYLVAPTESELAGKIGLPTQAKGKFYDLVIVGGGPAGLADAVYGASEGLSTLLIEHHAPGGQAGTSSRIENYLGFPAGVSGSDLAQRATAQARRFGAELLAPQEVVGLRREDPYRVVHLADGAEVRCYAVLLATGMSVRTLDAPGIERLLGAGVYYGAATTEAAAYRDQDVCVVGGANSAGQGAVFFARTARTVTMLVRAAGLQVSMSKYLIDRITALPNVTVQTRVQVCEARGNDHLEELVVRNLDGGETSILPCAAVFLFVGAKPHSGRFADLVCCDEHGFIVTGPDLPRDGKQPHAWPLDRDPFLFETSVPGVFAAGDVRAGANRRVAAAVGEGSAAVYSIHRYLETV
jgi:thioredoxin reductase (NADPH)